MNDEGDGYDYPYARIGFQLGSSDGDYDISSWGGFCIEYTSTINFSIELRPLHEETLTEYNNYKAAIKKSQTRTVMDVPWGRFKQEPGWGIPSVHWERVVVITDAKRS